MFKRSLPTLSAIALSIFSYSAIGGNLTAARHVAYAPFVSAEVLELRENIDTPWDTYSEAELEYEQMRWDALSQEAEDDPNEMPSNDDPVNTLDNADPSQSRMQIDVFRKPIGLGVDKEFMVVSQDHRPISAHVISTAKAGKGTIGDSMPAKREFMAKIELRHPVTGGRSLLADIRNTPSSVAVPFPWHVSSSYAGSTMYWGLQIDGPFWLHSTPHYRDLGKPASMGCVRVSFPTAMKVFDLAVNQFKGNVKVQMHNFSNAAKIAESNARWSELGLTAAWVNAQVQADYLDANAMPLNAKGDYLGVGHARRGIRNVEWPKCGNTDCFKSAPASAKQKAANPALIAPPAPLPAPIVGRN